jgi:oligosaccharide reducing-end xylanase
MHPRLVVSWSLCLGLALALLPSCKTTLDSVGCNERNYDGGLGVLGGEPLKPLLVPLSYPNTFRDLLGHNQLEIDAKVNGTFNQLFYGDPFTQAIYYPFGFDQAYIFDTFHHDIRTEGIGLGMLITVELNKRFEFDCLWRYAKSIQISSGARQGYFPSYCDTGDGNNTITVPCLDPFGLQQIATALLLARGRWQGAPGPINYGKEASALLDLMRNKETYNCGIVNGITGTFDAKSKLPYDVPTTASANISRPSIAMPAYYALWQQATGDPFWAQAADAARNYWRASANPLTGLVPQQATFDGMPVAGSDTFLPEGYRTHINMALDRIWSSSAQWAPWEEDESNLVLQFFDGQGFATYGRIYSLNGTIAIDPTRDLSLVVANGVLALIASTDLRTEFIDAVWAMDVPSGPYRYYTGLLDMLALLILSGQMRVY